MLKSQNSKPYSRVELHCASNKAARLPLYFLMSVREFFLAASDVRSNVNSGGVGRRGGISLMVQMILIKFVGQVLSSVGGDDGE